MDNKSIILKRGKEESLKRFHPWIFSGAIERIDGAVEEGDTVNVYYNDGSFAAKGHYQIGSIAVRILTFNDMEPDYEFYRSRIQKALEMRLNAGIAFNGKSDCFRLVHGEGDWLPGLVIDIYGKTAVMQAHSAGMHFAREKIADAITEVTGGKVENVYYKSDTTLPYKAQLDPQNEYIRGNYAGNTATENGLLFYVDWLKGQKTGFFLDQRDNRALLESYSKGRNVLNMFCYTGGFSFYAMRGGALKVDSVDSSAKAIDLTEKNVELNFPGDIRHKAYVKDAFKFLDDTSRDEYDLIILDPPAFAKHRNALHNALQGYKRLNVKAFEKIRSGGIIFTFSCSQAVSREQFRLAVFSAAAISGRKVRILHQMSQPADHPVNIYHPEGEYLKGLVLYVE